MCVRHEIHLAGIADRLLPLVYRLGQMLQLRRRRRPHGIWQTEQKKNTILSKKRLVLLLSEIIKVSPLFGKIFPC